MSNIVEQKNHIQEIVPISKKDLLRDMLCKGASDNELTLFIDICNKTNLDPFSKQCWAVKRWDKSLGREVMSFQTGVDGFRVIANRSSKYGGQVGPYWCGDDGKWVDVWLKNTPPVAAKVGIIRSDFKEPLWAVAKFSSYAAKTKEGRLTQFWEKMPDLMIAKVAECLALRKTFPQDLSGIYSQEEMEQSEIKDVTPVKEKPIELPKKETTNIVENKEPDHKPKNETAANASQLKMLIEKGELIGLKPSDFKSVNEQLWAITDTRLMKVWQFEVLFDLVCKAKSRDEFGKIITQYEGVRK